MKRRFTDSLIKIIILASLLLVCFSANSQSLVGKGYQLQYSSDRHGYSEMMYFADDGTLSILVSNFKTGEKGKIVGKYKIESVNLTISDDSDSQTFSIKWENRNVFYYYSNGSKLVYAEVMSPYDTFMKDYLAADADNTFKPLLEKCVACFGEGRCRVCGGDGIYSNYGQSSTCSACNGSGKCSQCGGTGKK